MGAVEDGLLRPSFSSSALRTARWPRFSHISKLHMRSEPTKMGTPSGTLIGTHYHILASRKRVITFESVGLKPWQVRLIRVRVVGIEVTDYWGVQLKW